MPQLTPKQKHDILTIYSQNKHIHSFESLAHQYNIKGGKILLSRWYHQWNGTPQSLERKRGSGRPTILTSAEVRDTIQLPIRNKNRASVPVHYPDLLPSITEKTGKKISLTTIKRIGHDQLGARQKRTNKRTAIESKYIHTIYTSQLSSFIYVLNFKLVLSDFASHVVTSKICDDIANIRRKIQRVSKNKILFMDEVSVKLNEQQKYTIVLPGEKSNVITTDTTSYAKRYDMIACCNGERVLPPIIFTPEDRVSRGVKGITKQMLERAVDNMLAQAVGALDVYPIILVMDKASIHKQDIIQV